MCLCCERGALYYSGTDSFVEPFRLYYAEIEAFMTIFEEDTISKFVKEYEHCYNPYFPIKASLFLKICSRFCM